MSDGVVLGPLPVCERKLFSKVAEIFLISYVDRLITPFLSYSLAMIWLESVLNKKDLGDSADDARFADDLHVFFSPCLSFSDTWRLSRTSGCALKSDTGEFLCLIRCKDFCNRLNFIYTLDHNLFGKQIMVLACLTAKFWEVLQNATTRYVSRRRNMD